MEAESKASNSTGQLVQMMQDMQASQAVVQASCNTTQENVDILEAASNQQKVTRVSKQHKELFKQVSAQITPLIHAHVAAQKTTAPAETGTKCLRWWSVQSEPAWRSLTPGDTAPALVGGVSTQNKRGRHLGYRMRPAGNN